MVEQAAVNRKVEGSSPSLGAIISLQTGDWSERNDEKEKNKKVQENAWQNEIETVYLVNVWST